MRRLGDIARDISLEFRPLTPVVRALVDQLKHCESPKAGYFQRGELETDGRALTRELVRLLPNPNTAARRALVGELLESLKR